MERYWIYVQLASASAVLPRVRASSMRNSQLAQPDLPRVPPPDLGEVVRRHAPVLLQFDWSAQRRESSMLPVFGLRQCVALGVEGSCSPGITATASGIPVSTRVRVRRDSRGGGAGVWWEGFVVH